ncbi:hypothetical protein [Arthrobacter sp. H16F315]|uniref:hypothetical protein n=1 Tax=Arthrobacter sp. H16F315 TaxID=2955314 RepID=UPI0031582C72
MTAPLATMVEEVLRPLAGGELPVRLVAWDGSEAGPAGAPVVRLNSPGRHPAPALGAGGAGSRAGIRHR